MRLCRVLMVALVFWAVVGGVGLAVAEEPEDPPCETDEQGTKNAIENAGAEKLTGAFKGIVTARTQIECEPVVPPEF